MSRDKQPPGEPGFWVTQSQSLKLIMASSAAVLLVATCLAFVWWQGSKLGGDAVPSEQGTDGGPRPGGTSPAKKTLPVVSGGEGSSSSGGDRGGASGATADHQADSNADRPASAVRPTFISQVTLKDQSGQVIYDGPMDLQPTLDRIKRGERNRHRNDGTVFRNREGQLPRKPSGYYHEYVVPTPGESGPGPQRLILGQGGEVYYTADHYRTFRKIEVQTTGPPSTQRVPE